MGAYRYLPMMKAKAGEVTALHNLPAMVRARTLPVLHIGESLAKKFGQSLGAAWQGHPAGLDGSFNATHTNNVTAFQTLITEMRSHGIHAMPSISVVDPQPYLHAAIGAIDANGLILKSTLGNLPATIGWVAQNGWMPGSIDLVIDMRHLGDLEPASFGGYVAQTINQNLGALSSFRSVTLASSAAPKDHGGLLRGVNWVPRNDWALWSAVHPAVGIRVDYGDYLTGHPDLKEPPGAAMASATVSARYTLDHSWLIIKGFSTGGAHGVPMQQQHQSHARSIVGTPGFSGLPGCWADAEYQAASVNITGRSGRQKWSEYAANRHISLVADRLP